jgi:hypothetical protein
MNAINVIIYTARHHASSNVEGAFIIYLVKSKICLAFANSPTSPLKGNNITEIYPGKCSLLGWPLPRVGKVAGSEAITTKRWNAIPQIT